MDIAPQASLYISNAVLYAGDEFARTRMKQDVDWMITQGVKVINYSIGWGLTEGFGDGAPQEINAVLDTIDTAVASGITWVNSAGNEHRRRWHGPFNDTSSPRDTYHDYALNDDRNYINNVQAGKPIIVEMRWDDSWKGANCDVDLYLFRDGLNLPVASAIKSQFGGADDKPYEEVKLNSPVAGNYYLRIRKFRCHDASDLSWLQLYVSGPYYLEHYSTGYSIEFPAESKNPGTLAVGAAKWSTPGAIQSYSSRGPTTDGRTKPEIVGADCGRANFYSESPPGCWFPGTSQAAPHVAGLAALVKDRFPDYSAEQTAIYLKENAEQRVPPAPDNTDPNNIWGHGFALLPGPADTASLSPVPSQITAGRSATFTLSTNVPASTGVRVAVNYPDDTGNLAISSLGTGTCPGSNDYRLATLSGNTVSVKGCNAGTAQVRLYKGSSAQQDTLLQVYDVAVAATAPTASGAPAAQRVNVGASAIVDVSSQFNGVVGSYSASSSNTSVATVSMSGSILIITGVTAGTATITVTATNSVGSVTQTYTVTAHSVATAAPITTGTTVARTLNVGASTTVNVSGQFSGVVDTYTASSSNTSVATASMSGPVMTITGVAAGSATITVTATNSLGSATQTYNVTVNSGSTAPTASGTPATRSVNVGASTTVNVSGDFTGTVTSYSASSSDTTKATASIPASSSTMTITGVAAGSATITVTATNSAGTATQTYTVIVTASCTTPGGPTIPTGGPSPVNAGSDQTVSRGAAVSLTGTGSPVNDDDDASYSWTQRCGATVSLKNYVTPSLPYTSGLAGSSAKFTAPATAGTLIFRLTVTDQGTNISSWDELSVTVQ